MAVELGRSRKASKLGDSRYRTASIDIRKRSSASRSPAAKSRVKPTVAALVVIFWAGCYAASHAENSMAATEGPVSGLGGDAGGADALETITVTARKRAESIQDVPLAIDAFDQNFLQRQVFTDIRQITEFTPSLQMPSSTGGSGGGIFLRGIGSISYSAVMDQAVALNFDGVQISTSLPLRTSTLDMDQVEVLKGPQALFFGKNSPGGVISFRSADPTDHPESMVRAGYETADRQQYYDAMISGPIAPGLEGRLAVHYMDQEGWLNVGSANLTAAQTGPYVDAPSYALPYDHYPKGHEIDTRGTLKYVAGDFQVTGKVTFSSLSGDGSNWGEQYISCPQGVPQYWYAPLPAVANIGNCRADNRTAWGGLSPTVLAHNPWYQGSTGGVRGDEQVMGSIDAKYHLEGLGLTLESVTGWYSAWDIGGPGAYAPTILANVASLEPLHINQGSEELRVSSNWNGPLNFVAGAFYDRSTNYSANDPAILLPAGGGYLFPGEESYRIGQNSISGFAQLSWKIVPQLEFAAGLRETHEVKTADGIESNFKEIPVVNNRLSFSNTSPEATLSYKPVKDLMFYASYKQGFKAGGFDTGYGRATQLAADPSANFSFQPERITGVEGGIKSAWLDGTLQLNLAGYGYHYSNMQLVSIVPPFSFFTINAAGSDIDGAEAELTWKPPVSGLTIHSSASYNKATYDKFLAECYGGQTISAGCNQAFDPATAAYTSQSLAGQSLAYAPRVSATLNLDYELKLGNIEKLGDMQLGFSSDTTFSSSYFTDIPDEPNSRQGSFAKADLSIRAGRADRLWEVAVICRNLTNRYTVIESHDSSFSGGGTGTAVGVLADTAGQVLMGRTFLIQLTVRPF
jgi:iron complex outermembrane receptor protein